MRYIFSLLCFQLFVFSPSSSDISKGYKQDETNVEQQEGKDRQVRAVGTATCQSPTTSSCCHLSLVPRNCYHAKLLGHTISGVYEIDPRDGQGSFNVYCDMVTDGGGWTVFQRRKDGSVDFYGNWDEYRTGFGELHGEFWLGLDKIHRLAVGVNLRVDLMSFEDSKAYAQYEDFTLGDASSKYVLYFGRYSGTAGDSLRSHNKKSMMFSTKDNDNDKSSGNCAVAHHGAWWYNGCSHSNLNGRYVYGGSGWDHVQWYTFKGTVCLQKSEMKLRNA